ncbi:MULTISPECIES: hypothetical protein, partial [unclassified Endozoicomonas]|uniref:hypothetical protein n=1 Tax=unclassified Endozoicomonas TaxID=2644528 RepID=UPI0021488578
GVDESGSPRQEWLFMQSIVRFLKVVLFSGWQGYSKLILRLRVGFSMEVHNIDVSEANRKTGL